MLHLKIHPVNPQIRALERVADILKRHDGICVYPTDTVYGLGACAEHPKAVGRIGTMLQKDKRRLFSYICSDFSQVSTYAKVSNAGFKIMKRYLPGPYSFILPATNYVPKKVSPRRRTVGIRIPGNIVVAELVRLLNEPLANTSVDLPAHMRGDPSLVRPAIENNVDAMLDAGMLDNPTGSTIVDLTGPEPAVIREGKGAWEG